MRGYRSRGRAVLALAIAACVLAWPAPARPQDEATIAPPFLDLVLYVEEQGRSGKRAADRPFASLPLSVERRALR
jgi:hypothetical protein